MSKPIPCGQQGVYEAAHFDTVIGAAPTPLSADRAESIARLERMADVLEGVDAVLHPTPLPADEPWEDALDNLVTLAWRAEFMHRTDDPNQDAATIRAEVERLLGERRKDAERIDAAARLIQKQGARLTAATALAEADDPEPVKYPVWVDDLEGEPDEHIYPAWHAWRNRQPLRETVLEGGSHD